MLKRGSLREGQCRASPTPNWLYLEASHARRKAGDELTRELVRRSRKQIEASQALLRVEVPKVWHPEPPTKNDEARRIVQNYTDDLRELQRTLHRKMN